MAGSVRVDGDHTRSRITSFLSNNQGTHLSAIIRALQLGNHQAAMHLKTLEANGQVWGLRVGQLLRYYTNQIPSNTPVDQLPNPPVTYPPDSMQFQIMDILARNPATLDEKSPLTQGKVAERLGCSQQLVSHHLLTLEGNGCVLSKRVGFRKQWRVRAAGLQAITGGLRSMSSVDHHDLGALLAHYEQSS